jgi:two-component system LytT family response regulator
MIRTLIVDDEPLSRELLRGMLAQERDVSIVGECSDGRQAIDSIQTLRPDLVLLDIQMPELNGFQVLEGLDDAAMPAIIFVTAYDRYAVRAFEVHALDYLLKPFDEERFRVALGRVRSRLGERRTNDLDQRLDAVLSELRAREQYADRLLVKATAGSRSFRSRKSTGSRRPTTTRGYTRRAAGFSCASRSNRSSAS